MIELETGIIEVTVYPDRAQVRRRGTAELEPGLHTLTIPDLPLGLDPDSVRAAGRGTAQARLLGVSVERTVYRESPAERVRELEDQIQSLEDQDGEHQNQETAIQSQLAHLNSLAGQTETFAKGLAFGRTTVSDQAALQDYLQEQTAKLLAQSQETMIARRELVKTLKKLREELKSWQGARPRQRHLAKIELEVATAGRFEADLVYTLRNASWKPLYDLRLWEASKQDEKPALELTYLGQVQQTTGEDWPDVDLVLSTARPAVSGALPEIKPWYLDIFRPLPPPAAQPKRARALKAQLVAPAAMMGEMMTGAVAKPAMEIQAGEAAVESTGTAVTFRVAGKGKIPADGQPHKVTVATFSLEPELDYLAVPKLVDNVHRRATVTNTTQAVLLPGRANVFAGDEFIGPTELEHVAPGQEFELALGVDDRIKVERELVAREVDKSFIGDKRRLNYGYEIKVQNLRPVTETVIVHDHYPKPRHEQIKVKLTSATPEPAESSELNLLEWKLQLAAGAEQIVRFDMQIEHPRSDQITGLLD